MPSYFNTNLYSFNAQCNLKASQRALSTSLQYLSSGMRVTASAFQMFFIVSLTVSLLVIVAQGIPYLAAHFDGVISTVKLGYWLFSIGAVLVCTTILMIIFSKN